MRRFAAFIVLSAMQIGLVSADPSWSLRQSDQGWNCPYFVKMYFHNSDMQTQWAYDLLGRVPFSGNERVLDFGCGDGKLTAGLSRFVRQGSITGVDLSDEMIHFANLKYPPYAYPNLRFETASSVDFSDFNSGEPYDTICSFCVMHLVPDPEAILKNLRNHLKPSGTLLLVIPAGGNPTFFQAAAEIFQRNGLDIPWSVPSDKLNLRTLKGCETILRNAGYEVTLLEKVDTDNPYVDKGELISWMIGTTSANWGIPKDFCHLFFTELVERMFELEPEILDSEGRIHFKMSRIFIIAKPNC